MTRDEAVTRIQEGLGFKTHLTTQIKNALEEVRQEMETGKTLPWFLRVEDDSLTLTAGTQEIALPTGFIRFEPVEPLRHTVVGNSYPTTIPWKTWAEAVSAYASETPGGPTVAVLRQDSIYFPTVADVDYTLYWTYYAHSDALNAADIVDHPWLVNLPQAIWPEAGIRIAQVTRDKEALEYFQELARQGRDSALREIVSREDTHAIVMGANH